MSDINDICLNYTKPLQQNVYNEVCDLPVLGTFDTVKDYASNFFNSAAEFGASAHNTTTHFLGGAYNRTADVVGRSYNYSAKVVNIAHNNVNTVMGRAYNCTADFIDSTTNYIANSTAISAMKNAAASLKNKTGEFVHITKEAIIANALPIAHGGAAVGGLLMAEGAINTLSMLKAKPTREETVKILRSTLVMGAGALLTGASIAYGSSDKLDQASIKITALTVGLLTAAAKAVVTNRALTNLVTFLSSKPIFFITKPVAP